MTNWLWIRGQEGTLPPLIKLCSNCMWWGALFMVGKAECMHGWMNIEWVCIQMIHISSILQSTPHHFSQDNLVHGKYYFKWTKIKTSPIGLFSFYLGIWDSPDWPVPVIKLTATTLNFNAESVMIHIGLPYVRRLVCIYSSWGVMGGNAWWRQCIL